MRLLGLPCARAPRLSSLFDVNHVGVGVGVLRVVCLLRSTYRGGVLPWDPPRRAGRNGDAALRRMFQARPGPYVPRCAVVVIAVCFQSALTTSKLRRKVPGLRGALLLVAAASLLAEPLHDLLRGLVLCFSGVAISAAAAVHDGAVCSRLSAQTRALQPAHRRGAALRDPRGARERRG